MRAISNQTAADLLPSVKKSRVMMHLQSFTLWTFGKYAAPHVRSGSQCGFYMIFVVGGIIVQETCGVTLSSSALCELCLWYHMALERKLYHYVLTHLLSPPPLNHNLFISDFLVLVSLPHWMSGYQYIWAAPLLLEGALAAVQFLPLNCSMVACGVTSTTKNREWFFGVRS